MVSGVESELRRESDSYKGLPFYGGERSVLRFTWCDPRRCTEQQVYGYNPGTLKVFRREECNASDKRRERRLSDKQDLQIRDSSRSKRSTNSSASSGGIQRGEQIRFLHKEDSSTGRISYSRAGITVPRGVDVIGETTPELARNNHVCRRGFMDFIRGSKEATRRKCLLPVMAFLLLVLFSVSSCTYPKCFSLLHLSLEELTNIKIHVT